MKLQITAEQNFKLIQEFFEITIQEVANDRTRGFYTTITLHGFIDTNTDDMMLKSISKEWGIDMSGGFLDEDHQYIIVELIFMNNDRLKISTKKFNQIFNIVKKYFFSKINITTSPGDMTDIWAHMNNDESLSKEISRLIGKPLHLIGDYTVKTIEDNTYI